MVDLIVMDLDGTLLNSEGRITDFSLDILEECRQQNIKLAFATARSEKSSRYYTELVNPHVLILNNGVMTKLDGKIFNLNLLNKITANEIVKKLYGNKNVGEIRIETQTNHFLFCDSEPEFNFIDGKYKYLSIDKGVTAYLLKIRIELFDENISKEIKANFNDCEVIEYSGEKWHSIVNKNASKIRALKKVIDGIDITMDNVIAFGDDYNDIGMIKECGIGIAMENGISEIKEIAKFVCRNNDDDGVAKWIKENVLR
jgi:Cof subfamily protein (haloacid dehalogenase superfamily)